MHKRLTYTKKIKSLKLLL